METYANSIEDHLIDSLTFKLDPTANYVTNRQSVTYYTQGANIYQSGSGSRVIRFTLSGNGQYLDPSTVRMTFTLCNNGAANQTLFPVGGPWSFFRRIRLLTGAGAVLEDIDYANRIHEMVHILTSKANRQNDCNVEGFGQYWDSDEVYQYVAGVNGVTGVDATQRAAARARYAQIPDATNSGGGNYRTVSFKPLFGLSNQPKYLPLQFIPLTLEFESVTSATDPIITPLDTTVWPTATTSSAWQIQDAQIKADVIELDTGLHNEYMKHLMAGNAIPINYNSYITQLQSVSGSNIAVNVTRSCTRLKTLFLNFDKGSVTTPVATNNNTLLMKSWNNFYHPMQGAFNWNREVQWQVLIGNKTYPIMPLRSAAEAYYQLQKGLGIHGSAWHSISIDSLTKYVNDHYIVALDTERVLGASFSGINCRQDLLTVQAKGANLSLETGVLPDQIYVVLNADYIVEIRDTGCTVFD